LDVDARIELGALGFGEDFREGLANGCDLGFDLGVMGLGRTWAAARRAWAAFDYAAGVPTPACSAQRPPWARFFRQPSLLHTL
jgi:hypothetical protein